MAFSPIDAKTFSTKLLNKMSEKGLEPSKISPYAPDVI